MKYRFGSLVSFTKSMCESVNVTLASYANVLMRIITSAKLKLKQIKNDNTGLNKAT